MDPAKTASIRDWQMPDSIKGIQAFLGFVNFNREFIVGSWRDLCTNALARMFLSSGRQTALSPSCALKRQSPQLHFWSISNPTAPVWLRQMHLILQLGLFYLNLNRMASCIRLRSIHESYLQQR